MNATPRPDEGVVSWNINTMCNYRCSYCTQRFKEDRGRWSRDTPRFLDAFARLPGRWEVKLSGGEPFVHPTLVDIVAGLARLGHRISVVTNFSAGHDKLAAFVAAAMGCVGVVSASLHLEYVDDVDGFADKAVWLAGELAAAADPSLPPPSVCVTSVATRATLARLPALAATFRARGVVYKVQPEKQDRDVIDYAPDEEEQILALGGHNLTGRVRHAYAGRPCWAGARYFILDDAGEAYRCYPARRAKIERMGSFLSPAFRLADDARPCRYALCNCTVPIARGMMPRDEAAVILSEGMS
jgi:MoaA/NifB/PqqE/SkfB family radical SAM enzyme